MKKNDYFVNFFTSLISSLTYQFTSHFYNIFYHNPFFNLYHIINHYILPVSPGCISASAHIASSANFIFASCFCPAGTVAFTIICILKGLPNARDSALCLPFFICRYNFELVFFSRTRWLLNPVIEPAIGFWWQL